MTKKEAQELFTKAVRIYITLADIGFNDKGDKLPALMLWVEDQENKVYPVYCEESKYWCESVGIYFIGSYLMDDWNDCSGGKLLYELGIKVADVYKVIEFWNGRGKWTLEFPDTQV